MAGLAFISNSGYVTVALMALTASCFGGFATLITPLTADMFGMKYLTENFGTMYIVFGFAAYIGPKLATSLATVAEDGSISSYSHAFMVAAVLSVVGIVLAFMLKGIDKKHQNA
jgi:OFA family oxalate/formate antiporter-like MFS transporter